MSFLIHENGYWDSGINNSHVYDHVLCSAIHGVIQKYNVSSLLDLGCGTADYCEYLISRGISCEAYDGNPKTPEISRGIGKILDIALDIDLNKTYDCVLSLEVGEHIPKQKESVFINNICKHANNLVIVSWAIPGQIGDGHINCATNDYIITQFEERNFSYNQELSSYLRNNSTAPWFKNTIMVFFRS